MTTVQAHAWTLKGDRRIAAAGAKLAPPDLLLVIKKFNKDYARGIAGAVAAEPHDAHGAELRARIDAQSKKVIAMLKANQPMSAVVEQLGVLAHLVANANNPFHVSDDNAASHDDFESYFEARMEKFPLVFYGPESNLKLTSYLDRILSRTTRFVPLMREEYGRGNSQTFDDHSTAFGVASVCYSHAVTDTANVFSYIWREAGGLVLNAKKN